MNRLTGIQDVDIRAFLQAAYDLRDEQLLDQLCGVATLREFAPKERILNVGDPVREIMVLVSGTVRSFYVDYEGVATTDSFVNQVGYPINSPRLEGRAECGLEACDAVTLLCIPLDWLLAAREQNVTLLHLQIRLMEWAIYFQWNEKAAFSRLTAKQRYVRFRKEYPGIDGQISSKYIAEYIGVAPESLSRLRRELREASEART